MRLGKIRHGSHCLCLRFFLRGYRFHMFLASRFLHSASRVLFSSLRSLSWVAGTGVAGTWGTSSEAMAQDLGPLGKIELCKISNPDMKSEIMHHFFWCTAVGSKTLLSNASKFNVLLMIKLCNMLFWIYSMYYICTLTNKEFTFGAASGTKCI